MPEVPLFLIEIDLVSSTISWNALIQSLVSTLLGIRGVNGSDISICSRRVSDVDIISAADRILTGDVPKHIQAK